MDVATLTETVSVVAVAYALMPEVTNDPACVDGGTEDRAEIVKCQRALSKHDHRHTIDKTDKYTSGRARKVKSLQKAHARLKARERHALHRLVHHIISMCVEQGIDGIAVELLHIRNMMRNPNLSDRIQQQRWGMFLRMLEVKAARAGIKYVEVNPRHTSLECSQCSNRKPAAELPLNMRVYECEVCGLVLDRDVNAALNVLIRGFGQRFRNEGGVSPSVWSEHTLTGVPSPGRTSDGNYVDSASSDVALLDEPQTRQYALVNPGI